MSDDKYSFLSNFYESPFKTVDCREWKTVEHYFQAMKFNDYHRQREVLWCDTPKEARQLGKKPHKSFKSNWDTLRLGYMYLGLKMKFADNICLEEKLLSTGDSILIEHAPWDSFWGDGGNGRGRNMLGEYLMLLRGNIKLRKNIDILEKDAYYNNNEWFS